MAALIRERARAHYYDGPTLQRVEPDFVIQGGSPRANEYVGNPRFIRDELGTVPHVRGTVGMSTRGHDTGDAQWFVNLRDNLRLNPDYTIFGEVVEGIDVVDGVLEGDVEGSMDADRLASLHVPVTQLNTGTGFGGECHLDANMVRSAIPALPLEEIDLLLVENVGNLVCPAEFRIGEDARVMVSAVTEGEDKPLKYPLMFRACELVIVNKIDLLPHLDFDLDKILYNIDVVHPDVERIVLSARTGEGIDAWRDWLLRIAARAPEEAVA
jgi:hydrogenase nickel incorporation protein HypB